MSREYIIGCGAASAVTIFADNISARSLNAPSFDVDHVAPLREQTILGLPHFYDHAGNFINGSSGALFVLVGGAVIEHFVPERKRGAALITAAVGSATLSSGVNIAYEAGMKVPTFPKKPEGAPFDGADALYGSAAAVTAALAFAAATFGCRALLRRVGLSGIKDRRTDKET